mmetsp:Transcript_29914/g.63672  ORF Transcript_29914/g.63672 Transcript_29914/m.63672 type:complete len:84 (-) Transcript_29914:305-556(-)
MSELQLLHLQGMLQASRMSLLPVLGPDKIGGTNKIAGPEKWSSRVPIDAFWAFDHLYRLELDALWLFLLLKSHEDPNAWPYQV